MGSTRWFADVRSVRLGSSDLDASVRFATEILGLELVRRDGRRAYLRAGAGRDHHLEYVRGEAGVGSLAFETGSREALEALAAGLARDGHAVREASRAECDERYAEAAYVVSDPTGNRLDLAHGGASAEAWVPARDTGITVTLIDTLAELVDDAATNARAIEQLSARHDLSLADAYADPARLDRAPPRPR